MTALEVDIGLRRGSFELDVTASMDAPTVGLFGRSGSGKTTLLHIIAGLVTPDRGRVSVKGRCVHDSGGNIALPVHERRVGLVFQDDRLFPHYSVHGNLGYGARHGSGRGADGSASEASVIELLDLGRMLTRRPRELSGGERRRVALGRALLAGPDLLLLDEPLAGLDAAMKRDVLPYLVRIRAEMDLPMLYVSHDLGEVLRLTDQLLLLDDGRVAGQGAYADLVHRADLTHVLHGLGLTNLLRLEPSGDAGRPWRLAGTTTALRLPVEPGTEAPTATVRPEDIALALAPVEGTSIQNQMPGCVRRVAHSGERVVVEVDIGQTLQVEITPRALEALHVAPGLDVWCLVKSTAMSVES